MGRLTFLLALLYLMLGSGSALAAEVDRNEMRLDAPRVQQYLLTAFPQSYQALGGLLTVTARDPQLEIPAEGERLRMSFYAEASTAAGETVPIGRLLMSSGLRYDPAGYALYLDQPTLDDLQPAASGHRVDAQTRMLVNLWLADYAGAEPLYRLEPALIAMLGPLKVESARIEDGHIVVRFNQPLGELPAYLDEDFE